MKRFAALVIALIIGLAGGTGIGLGISPAPVTHDPLGTVQTAQRFISKQLGHPAWTTCFTNIPCVTTTSNDAIYQITGSGDAQSIAMTIDLNAARKLSPSAQAGLSQSYGDSLDHFAGESAASGWVNAELSLFELGVPINATQLFGIRIHLSADPKAEVVTVTFSNPN